MENNIIYDVIVVGGGPAAISSAIYSARKGLVVGLIADSIGGQVITTNAIENIIGTSSTTGYEFTTQLEKHFKEYNIPFYQGHLLKEIEIDGDIKILKTDDKIFKSKSVIIATGAKHKKLNVLGEEEYANKGVHYCATCDGAFYRNLDVMVVGGGNSGVEAALDLANITKSVTIVEYNEVLNADKILQEKIYSNPKIKVITNTKVKEIKGEMFVTNVDLEKRHNEELTNIKVDGVFVEIGLIPNTEFLKDLLKLNSFGEIEINHKNETSIKGIFSAGDCTNVPYKQIVIAIGEGAKAALSAFAYVINL